MGLPCWLLNYCVLWALYWSETYRKHTDSLHLPTPTPKNPIFNKSENFNKCVFTGVQYLLSQSNLHKHATPTINPSGFVSLMLQNWKIICEKNKFNVLAVYCVNTCNLSLNEMGPHRIHRVRLTESLTRLRAICVFPTKQIGNNKTRPPHNARTHGLLLICPLVSDRAHRLKTLAKSRRSSAYCIRYGYFYCVCKFPL